MHAQDRDSVTSAFGNEGKATSAKNRFGMKGRMENVYNGYACIVARMFRAEAHVLAWSGKGVHSNAGDWGPNMPALWKNTIASREGAWSELASWTPDVVVVNLGVNDLFPPASLETEIVSAYALFLTEVRQLRPHAHIFCVAYDESCMSAEDSETNRSHAQFTHARWDGTLILHDRVVTSCRSCALLKMSFSLFDLAAGGVAGGISCILF